MQGEFPLNLRVSPEEAVQKIQERIVAGQSLHDLSINTQDALFEAQKKLKNWSTNNRTLLSELFNTSSNADNYNNLCEAYSITSSTSTPSPSSGSAINAGEEFSRTSNIFGEITSEHIEKLTKICNGLMLHCEPSDSPQRTGDNNKITDKPTHTLGDEVFIVHGHDEAAKLAVARFVEKLDIEPIILDEQPNEGQTIIDKFENHAGEAAFAIVLLTPDDVGASKDKANELQPRARQNVILELGYFLGKLGRERACVLYKEGVELPSDIHGILYLPMNSPHEWQLKLAQEMKQAGLPIDLNQTRIMRDIRRISDHSLLAIGRNGKQRTTTLKRRS